MQEKNIGKKLNLSIKIDLWDKALGEILSVELKIPQKFSWSTVGEIQ